LVENKQEYKAPLSKALEVVKNFFNQSFSNFCQSSQEFTILINFYFNFFHYFNIIA